MEMVDTTHLKWVTLKFRGSSPLIGILYILYIVIKIYNKKIINVVR